MAGFIFNSKFFKQGEPVIGPGNRGLRYGDGLFETMKMLDGKLILSDLHFARLWKGMKTLSFDIPRLFSPEKLSEEILGLAKKNGHEKSARIRLQVLRGDGGLYDTDNHQPNHIIETWQLPAENNTLNSNGLIAGIYTDSRKNCDILSNVKHSNYLPYVMAALQAKKEKWNDAFLLNSNGRVCDSTIANIFIVKNKMVYTPSLSEACVAGVMREHIIDVLKTTAWKVSETHITTDDILEADEVFLSNSIYNIRWVKNIGSTLYNNTVTQKIYLFVAPTIK